MGATIESTLRWHCPETARQLKAVSADSFQRSDGYLYRRIGGIWRFLLPERLPVLEQFMNDYAAIREQEDRGSAEASYYRALPFNDLSGVMPDAWRIRAASYRLLENQVLNTIPKKAVVFDLGAGNGWLSGRLAARGLRAVAVDLQTNKRDGLGACRHYEHAFVPVQAEFERLPFEPEQADLIIFNASLHYSTSYMATLNALRPMLKPNGRFVIMDTPFYRSQTSGEQMVYEREEMFERNYGFRSDALASENFLTYDQLTQLGKELNIRWTIKTPLYGVKWALRPLRARIRGHREPAKFHVIIGQI